MNVHMNLMMEVAESAFWRGQKEQELRRPAKVGEAYESLPEDVKEKLKTLKSEDFKQARWDAINFMCYPIVNKRPLN